MTVTSTEALAAERQRLTGDERGHGYTRSHATAASGGERGRFAMRLVGVVFALFMVGAISAPVASAHGGEADQPARDLVFTALAVLEAHPSALDLVKDKINDALDSTEPGDVDLELVRQAQDALAGGDIGQTTALLELSVGACAGAPAIYVPPAADVPAPGSPCATPVYVLGLPADSVSGIARVLLLLTAVVFAAGGALVLSRVH